MKNIRVILILLLTISHSLLIAQSNRKLILKHKDFPSKLYSVKNHLANNNSLQHLNKASKQKKSKQNSNSTIIGNTTYDLQTTGSMPRRFISYPNGKLATAWLGSSQESIYSDLGTRYNSFNGSQWGSAPIQRIETRRTINGGLNKTRTGEISIATPNAITIKSTINTTWDTTRLEQKFENLNWPRTASVGDTVYTIFGSNTPDSISGFKAPIYFTRSIDGGLTFSTPTALFAQTAGYDTSNFIGDIGPDHYAIDAVGNTVAILLIGVTEDVVVLKSNNCGNTWTKSIVQEFPIHKYNGGITDTNGDGLCDTVIGVTGDGSILIDNNGTVHIVYSDLLLRKCDSGDITIYPINKSDYFKYWNENEKILVEVPTLLDINGNGVFDVGSNFNSNVRYGNSGYSFHPTLSVSGNNFILLAYAATTELDSSDFGQNFHNIYGIVKYDNSWCLLGSISNSISQENVFPNTPNRTPYSWGDFYVQWQQDFDPGSSVNGAHSVTLSDIVFEHLKFNNWYWRCFSGMKTASVLNHKLYPNPTDTCITIEIEAAYSMLSSVKIINGLGQTMLEKQYSLFAGINKKQLDTSILPPGIYTVLINTDNSLLTEKIIIK